ncbi:MAG: hypothetical protein WBQ26_04315 [Gemmatimonadaceae bacterium]|nr:hypothetical protein [Gemmatimonadaceae bacterium]
MAHHTSSDTARGIDAFAADGHKGFAASASRTVGVAVDLVYAAWTDDTRRREWLRDDQLVVVDTTSGVSLHGEWAGTRLRVFFMPRGNGRAHVMVDHDGLPTARRAEQMKKFWQARLGRLAALVERPGR